MNVELLKWTGFGAMLVEHVPAYVFGASEPWQEAVGSLAFPLFVFGFALGLGLRQSGIDRFPALVGRMAVWCVVAQAAGIYVGRLELVNVLGTFAAGTALYWAVSGGLDGWRRVGAVALIAAVSMKVEFWWVGVALVAAAIMVARERSVEAGAVSVVLLAALMPWNGSWWALAAVPIAAALACCPLRIPRARGIFYGAYALQFPVFWVVATLLAAITSGGSEL